MTKSMKNAMLTVVIFAAANFANAQEHNRNPPATINQSFHKDYPEAGNATWSHSNNEWHANFNDRSAEDRGEMVAHYDQSGRHIDSHVPYARQDVPAPVYNSARKRYQDDNERYTRIEHPTKGDFFEVRGRVHGKARTSYYDEQGRERNYDDRH